MKRFLSLVCAVLLVFAVVSCGKKKKEEIPGYEEQVSKEIKAEEGGKVESSDGKTSVEIPGGALDKDTTITMTIYDAAGYSDERGKVISKVVDFEPDGTIFKKPVLITMKVEEGFENKVVAAAVLHEDTGEWSYSENSEYAALGRDAAGDPIMTSAAGDPIMLNAAGDPIMQNAAGDPIMMASAGDPIMTSAAGDPIMNAAAGDPIMMSSGHFTAYTFIVLDPKEPEETDDDEPVAASDDDEPVDDSDTDTPETDDDTDTASSDEDVVPEPEPDPVYSKVVCTGLRTCFSENGEPLSECPKEGAMSGQDAGYIFRKSCVPRNFELIENEFQSVYQQTKDNNTGLTWLYTGESGALDYEIFVEYDEENEAEINIPLADFCDYLKYDGHDDWRMPAPKEFLTISDYDIFSIAYGYGSMAINKSAFPNIASGGEGTDRFWTSAENFFYDTKTGTIVMDEQSSYNGLLCVRGEEYGKVEASDYTSVNNNGEEMILDSKTDLYWQKTSVNGKTWKEALAYCESLEYAGKGDWRLPSRNELATLIDYSKSNPASSFPGIPSAVFATSTYIINSGEIAVNMGTGEVVAENESVDYSVICVRSDLLPYPENGIPECGDDGYAPCKLNGITWSARMYFDPMNGGEDVLWSTMAGNCHEMSGGKWRLPDIDEVRTLFTDDAYKPDGTCGVRSDCTSSKTCYNEEQCPYLIDSSATLLGDEGVIVSGTLSNFGDVSNNLSLWSISTEIQQGGIVEINSAYGPVLVVRCVLDETLSLPETAPYTDEENGLVWSPISELGTWKNAVEYCGTLDIEGVSDNWRVPTENELRKSLVVNCPNGNCTPDLSGRYSVFRDIPLLLSRDVSENNFMTTVNFIDASTETSRGFHIDYDDMQVRCVHTVGDPDRTIPATPYEVNNQSGHILWSERSDFIEGITYAKAENYCQELSAEAGENWQVARADILKGILKNCEGFDPPSREEINETSCLCDKNTFESYSIFNDFGDMFLYYDDGYILFNFTTGTIKDMDNGSSPSESPAFVRCFTYMN